MRTGAGLHTVARWCGLGLLCLAACSRTPPDDRPAGVPQGAPPLKNLVWITLDTQRADRLALFGGSVETPSLARLAARGVLFERAYSHAPMTGPSHASMFTGLLPVHHGVRNNGQRLPERLETLAEAMKAGGRRTAAFVSLDAMSPKYGFGQGFDHYDLRTKRLWWMNAEELNAALLPWVETVTPPFFLFAHYSDPHGPYLPPDWYGRMHIEGPDGRRQTVVADFRRAEFELTLAPGENRVVFRAEGRFPLRPFYWKYDPSLSLRFGEGWEKVAPRAPAIPRNFRLRPGQEGVVIVTRRGGSTPRTFPMRFELMVELTPEQKRRGYDLETAYADRQLGRLLDLLEARGLVDETLVVFTADHGEQLGESGYFGHVHNLHRRILHVPLIVVAPGHLPAGVRVKTPVGLIDVLPTLLPMLGRPVPEGLDGHSLVPIDAIELRPVLSSTWRPQARHDKRSAILGTHRLERVEADDGITWHLYDLHADPEETHDFFPALDEHPRLRRLFRRLAPLLEGEAARPEEIPLAPEDIEALKALGYVE